MKYKTEVFLQGGGFNKTVAAYIIEGWAIFKIWTLHSDDVGITQVIVTFIKNDSLLQSL